MTPEIIAPQGVPVYAKETACIVEDAATRIFPVTCYAGYAGDRAHRHSAATVSLNSDADPDASRSRVGESLAQVNDRAGGKAGNPGRAFWRELKDALTEGFPADGAAFNECVILSAFCQDNMQKPERQRCICTGNGSKVQVTCGSGPGANRIDGDDRRTVFLRLQDGSPEMWMR